MCTLASAHKYKQTIVTTMLVYRFTLHNSAGLCRCDQQYSHQGRSQSAVDYTGRESKEPRSVPTDEKGVRFDIILLFLLVCCPTDGQWGNGALRA